MNKDKYKNHKQGFVVSEILISLAIFAVLAAVVLIPLISFRKDRSLAYDTQTVSSVLRQARNQTLSSKNSSVYGVHFASSKVTLFTGTSYSSSDTTNEDFVLSSTDTILTITLTGGGSDIVFNRLTGETSQDGTVVISSSGVSETKTVTIYKTGLVDSQ